MSQDSTALRWNAPTEIPVAGSFDVVVAGGGIAGAAAALAAARCGATVCILEREYMSGGLSTLGLVWCYLPLCDGKGHQVSGGISEELLRLSIENGTGSIPECWERNDDIDRRKNIRFQTEFNPATLAINLDKALTASGVTIRYGSIVCDVIRNGASIEALVAKEKEGFRAIQGKCFLDATGDADICAFAKEETIERSDNRLAYWQYFTDGRALDRQESQVPLFGKLPDGEKVFSGIRTDDIVDFCMEGRKRIASIDIAAGNRVPILIPSIPQFRMSRRLVGRSTLFPSDEGKWCDDAIGIIADWRFKGKVYAVPYGILLPMHTDNLWVAGRCVSADESAGDTVRSIPACAVFGQAAGTAAALAAKMQIASYRLPITILQENLRSNSVILDRRLVEID